MVDNLADKMHHEWSLMNSDAGSSNNLLKTQSLTRKLSDQTGHHSSHHSSSSHNQHHHTHQHHHQQSTHSPPMITTTDYSDRSSLSAMHVPHALLARKTSDTGYDTDGGIGASTSKSRHHNTHGYEHFVSPRLPKKRTVLQLPRQLPASLHGQRASPHSHLTIESGIGHNYEDKDDDSTYEGDGHRRHIRLSRRIPQRPSSTTPHGAHAVHSSTISRHEGALASTTSGRPFKLIFMRHSERVNQALGSDWYSKAFRTSIYQSFDQNLPTVLPKRNYNEAYEFDTPLTVRGLKNARHTGRVMLSSNLAAGICLSSTALRCIQTAERILTGMECADHVSIRIEPGLFECPHLNHKIVDSFMTKKELLDNGYKIKPEYKPIIQKVNTPESLDEYFDRCVTVMRGIIDRYGHHGGTVLILTHAPGLLALTDAMQGRRPNHETFYRTVATYPPLAAYVAEYDGTKWNNSDQPFAISIPGQ